MRNLVYIIFVFILSLSGCKYNDDIETKDFDLDVVSIKKVSSQSLHNAFTDLIDYNGDLFLSYRHGSDHVNFDGENIILKSSNGIDWEQYKKYVILGLDIRDSYFYKDKDNIFLAHGIRNIENGKYTTYNSNLLEETIPIKFSGISDNQWLWGG